MAHKILCLYSGGIDSTAMLWKITQDSQYSDYDILVHHVHIINQTNRFNAEKKAVDKIIPLLKKYNKRIFFSSTLIDLSFMENKIPIDANLYGFVAANLINIDNTIKYIAVGRTLDDKNSGGSQHVQIIDCIENAISQINYMNDTPSQAICITPIVELTKKELWLMLPEEIKPLTWSCRVPTKQTSENNETIYTPCQKCHACLAIKELTN